MLQAATGPSNLLQREKVLKRCGNRDETSELRFRLWGYLENEGKSHFSPFPSPLLSPPYPSIGVKMGEIRKITQVSEFSCCGACWKWCWERSVCPSCPVSRSLPPFPLPPLPPSLPLFIVLYKVDVVLYTSSQPCSWCSILRSKMMKRGSYDLVWIAATLTSSTGALQHRNGSFLLSLLLEINIPLL